MNISPDGFLEFSKLKSALEYRTLLYLLANSNENGFCDIRQKEIAENIHVKRQAINRSINSLAKKNIFIIHKNGTKRSYQINPKYLITLNT